MTRDCIAYAQLFSKNLPPPKTLDGPEKRYNFGSGHNDPETFPVEALAAAAARVMKREGKSLSMYELGGSALGHAGLRRTVAEKLRRFRGVDVHEDGILITSGSLQGMDLVNRLLLDPGDVVILEQFTYVAAIAKLKALGVRAIPAPLDDGGLDVSALTKLLAALQVEGVRPKYIYTIPTVQNPTGTILSLDRRYELIALSRKYGIPLIEDECYADLAWNETPPPALYGLAPDTVIHIGSLSKTLAPAMRVGYLAAPWPTLAQMLALKTDGGTGALDQMVAAEYFKDSFETHLDRLKRRLEYKCNVLIDALSREFGTAVEVTAPQGGLFAWIKFSQPVDTNAIAQAAATAGVAVNPGRDWAVVPDDGACHMRLCFGLVNETQINEGIAELARICFEVSGTPEWSNNASNSQSRAKIVP